MSVEFRVEFTAHVQTNDGTLFPFQKQLVEIAMVADESEISVSRFLFAEGDVGGFALEVLTQLGATNQSVQFHVAQSTGNRHGMHLSVAQRFEHLSAQLSHVTNLVRFRLQHDTVFFRDIRMQKLRQSEMRREQLIFYFIGCSH
jgi:hypothetical protein